IGAGIAGLSAGCYARMNGYRTTIFEMHDKPGGLCTSWKRRGYTIDGCLHWLCGSAPGTSLHEFWTELGAVQGKQMVDHAEYMRVRSPEGKVFIAYTNADCLEKHMLELSPQDSKMIRKLTGVIRRFSRFDLPAGKPREIAGWTDKLKLILRIAAVAMPLMRWSKISIHDYAQRFKDPFLRKAFPKLFDLPGFPMFGAIITLAWMHAKVAGYPIGGSLEFARSIEHRFFDLGGEVKYKSRVARIVVENDRAKAVQLENGTVHNADIVISAADGHATIFDMLEGKYIDDEIKGYYEAMPKFKSLVHVGVGVARDLSEEPHTVHYLLDEPITVGDEKHHEIWIRICSFDPTLAPEGKSVIVSMFLSDQSYWKELQADRERYNNEKQKVADAVIGHLETLYPRISQQVEMVDVATPVTFERYTGNWEGSMEGWLPTTKNMLMQMKRVLPGL
ncbi:MAG: NAD(P)/FAD-dependent oxidoreductase, partial [Armatimonadetes bacterium]|nr:NAD(P)/FAD-dependent oxidoreductase [Armatimonadota bacterium]